MPRSAMCIVLIALGCLVAAMPAQAKRQKEPIVDPQKAHPEPIMESDQPDAKKKAVYLPTLKEGPGKGFYLFYPDRYYDVAVKPDGSVVLRLKDDKGKLISGWWEVHNGIHTGWHKIVGFNKRNKPIKKGFVRYIKEIVEAPEPDDAPHGEMTVNAILMDDVEFVRTYEFKRDTIYVRTGYECENVGFGSEYGNTIVFGAVKKFAPSVPQKQREEELKGYLIEVKRARRKQELPYYKSEDFVNPVGWVHVVGPWQDREIFFKADDDLFKMEKYRGKPPYQGFKLHFKVPNHSTKPSKRFDFEITLE